MEQLRLLDTNHAEADRPILAAVLDASTPAIDPRVTTADLIVGEARIRPYLTAIQELRMRCGQHLDLTTDPQYFVASNTMRGRRVAAVLIRRERELEACVYLFEYCFAGVPLGVFRGGDPLGDGLVIGQKAYRVHSLQRATQMLLERWRIFGISFSARSPLSECIAMLGPRNRHRAFAAETSEHRLILKDTYPAMLASMGPRTRRSLAGNRRKLEVRTHVSFLPSLDPGQALEAMLSLQSRSLTPRSACFYQARATLLSERSEFFCMGLRALDGTWLSILSGWRITHTTFVDLQMNDRYLKKQSLSAVMRAFLLEHEIALQQKLINFVGGTSMLLRRYCHADESSTHVCIWRPCFRATLFRWLIPRLKPDTFYVHTLLGKGDPVTW